MIDENLSIRSSMTSRRFDRCTFDVAGGFDDEIEGIVIEIGSQAAIDSPFLREIE